uniref:ABC transporter domain-containing protein n=1 Tax=Caenorhabditis tropicalis TaxID=1561998 RepID=A0A1I7UJI9_9PELO
MVWKKYRNLTDRTTVALSTSVDRFAQCRYLSHMSNRWLATRLELLGNTTVLFASLSATLSTKYFGLTPGMAGLSVSYALTITEVLNICVRSVSEIESNIVSVERVNEYQKLESEAPWHVEGSVEEEKWPTKGKIELEGFSMRYRNGLPLVLKEIDLRIEGGEMIGVIGRTGSGKSSLTMALYRYNPLKMGEFKIYSSQKSISDSVEPGQMRAQLHCHRPSDMKLNLSSSTSNLMKAFGTKSLLNKMSSQIMNTSKEAIQPKQWLEAKIKYQPAKQRNNYKFASVEDILRSTRIAKRPETNEYDNETEAAREFVEECQSFAITCFTDFYGEREKTPTPAYYDIAQFHAERSGYLQKLIKVVPKEDRSLASRVGKNGIDKEYRKSRNIMMDSPSQNQMRTTPRMIKKSRDQTSGSLDYYSAQVGRVRASVNNVPTVVVARPRQLPVTEGLPLGTITFPLFEVQAKYCLSLISGHGKLPPNYKNSESERLQSIQNPSSYHIIIEEQWEYMKKLSEMGGFDEWKYMETIRKLYTWIMTERKKNVIGYKNVNFELVKETNDFNVIDI